MGSGEIPECDVLQESESLTYGDEGRAQLCNPSGTLASCFDLNGFNRAILALVALNIIDLRSRGRNMINFWLMVLHAIYAALTTVPGRRRAGCVRREDQPEVAKQEGQLMMQHISATFSFTVLCLP